MIDALLFKSTIEIKKVTLLTQPPRKLGMNFIISHCEGPFSISPIDFNNTANFAGESILDNFDCRTHIPWYGCKKKKKVCQTSISLSIS